jgi:hypothetical protein
MRFRDAACAFSLQLLHLFTILRTYTAREQVAEAKEDAKEVERNVAAVEAKIAEAKKDVTEAKKDVKEAEAKVAAARQAVNWAVSKEERAEANCELEYAQEARATALDALKSSQEGQAV